MTCPTSPAPTFRRSAGFWRSAPPALRVEITAFRAGIGLEKFPARGVAAIGGRYALTDNGETPDTQDVLFDCGKFTAAFVLREASGGERGAFPLVFHGTRGSLGLDRLSDEEFTRFERLNKAYGDKFSFPFIICVRRHTRDSILTQFERRLALDAKTERARALDEIGMITRLRLVGKVDGPGKPKTDGRLSTHVLDTFSGRPAAGVRIELFEIGASARGLLVSAATNSDGRTDAALIAGEPLRVGSYELAFHIGAYFAQRSDGKSRTIT